VAVSITVLVSDLILLLNILTTVINCGPHSSSWLDCYLLWEMEKKDCIDFTTSDVYKGRWNLDVRYCL